MFAGALGGVLMNADDAAAAAGYQGIPIKKTRGVFRSPELKAA
jgi:hypothetical protein